MRRSASVAREARPSELADPPSRLAPWPLRRWVILVVGATVLAVHWATPSSVLGSVSFVGATGAGALAAWMGAARLAPPRRRPWQIVALGLTLSSIADGIWEVFRLIRGAGPDVSIADAFWIASFLILCAGILRLLVVDERSKRVDVEGLIDMAVMVTLALVVIWYLEVAEVLGDSSVALGVRVVWASYPVLDAALLALVARTVIDRRAHSAASLLLATGALCWLGADLAYLHADAAHITVWLDSGWMVGAALLGGASWLAAGPAPAERPAQPLGIARLAVGFAPLLVPASVELWMFVRGDDTNSVPLFAASLALITLAFLRSVRLLRANERIHRQLEARERHFESLAANSADAVVVLDREGRIIEGAPSLGALLGTPAAPAAQASAPLFPPGREFDSARDVFERCLLHPGRVFDAELSMHAGEGPDRWLAIRVVNLLDDPDTAGVVANVHDVTDRKRAEEALAHQAFHDSLTALPNRALFADRLEHALRRSRRSGLQPVVVYLDLDGFKNVNDSLGHGPGDKLLCEVAERLLTTVRVGDTVARLGGDEFALLIEQSTRPIDEAQALAERVLQALSPPIALGDQQVTVSASIGIAAGDASATGASLLRDADVAMYRAKTTGRSRWVVYDPEMRSVAVEQMRLAADLVGALDEHQLRLVFQPIVELEDERVVGFEALLRWDHPTLGAVMPERFVPIAEENGLMVPIGAWVLLEACRAASRWAPRSPAERPLRMAVKITARQLSSARLVHDVSEALATSGLDASALVLEMTESTLVQDSKIAVGRLQELHDLGVRLAIDEFGTGYSSTDYLRQYPVDILKISRAFINTITDRGSVPGIVRGLLDLGRTLELETVAGGVERDEQRESLLGEHCGLAQGYLFSGPLEQADAELLVARLAPGWSEVTSGQEATTAGGVQT
jgi:diguanylate cyclase (GGDEF)-like protein/PAS domain S-box-containing protein